MKTPAAILVEQRRPLILDEVELPPLGYGQVLVDIQVSRICGSQIGEIDGVKGTLDGWLQDGRGPNDQEDVILQRR